MKKFISAALVVAMTAASCANKDDLGNDKTPQQPSVDGTMIFSAQFAGPAQPSSVAAKVSPTYVENDKDSYVEVRWDQYDKVGVYAQDGAPSEFVAQSGGEESTTLKGSIQEAETYYAMYPYDAEAVIENGVISTALPAAQIATKDAFAAHLAVSSTNSNSFTFQNVCGLVRVNIGCEHVTSIEFKGNDEEIVAGDIDITASTAEYANGTTQEKVITVTPPTGSETFEVGAYYFSVLPQTFEKGFTVTYNTADDVKELRQAGKVIIPRSKLVVGKAFTDITGAGTVNDPYVIKTAHDLCSLSAKLATDEKNECYVELANDIDMSSVTEWTPINNTRVAAEIDKIHFDGKGKTIKNFGPETVVAGAETSQVGLFGTMYGVCKNLTLEVDINLPSAELIGSVCGFAGYPGLTETTYFQNVHVSGKINAAKVVGGFAAEGNGAKFEKCSTDMEIEATDNQSGGFIARCGSGTNEFVECSASGKLDGMRYTGGFMGGDAADNKTPDKLIYTRCWADVDIDGAYQMGAFLGYTKSETVITDCYATGTVKATKSTKNSKQCGGLVGVSTGTLTVSNSYYEGSVEISQVQAGGILALNTATAKIEKSFSIADIKASVSSKNNEYGTGGIVGNHKSGSLTVQNCYAAGNLTSTDYVGGIIGNAMTDVTVTNCGFGGILPSGATNCAAIVGIASGTDNTFSGCWYFNNANASSEATTYNGEASTGSSADYETASKVASKLGWDTTVWDLTGDTPKLNCFKK